MTLNVITAAAYTAQLYYNLHCSLASVGDSALLSMTTTATVIDDAAFTTHQFGPHNNTRLSCNS
jgi:hypothetical protein